MKNITNVNRRDAERCPSSTDVAIISITDPSQPAAVLTLGWRAVLRLTFHDRDPNVFSHVMTAAERSGYHLMTPEHAAQIAAFVRANQDVHILVHCEAGSSRSYAVARAVAASGTHIYAGNGGIKNSHVYRLVYDALQDVGMAA